jgi:hypothetical protein
MVKQLNFLMCFRSCACRVPLASWARFWVLLARFIRMYSIDPPSLLQGKSPGFDERPLVFISYFFNAAAYRKDSYFGAYADGEVSQNDKLGFGKPHSTSDSSCA